MTKCRVYSSPVKGCMRSVQRSPHAHSSSRRAGADSCSCGKNNRRQHRHTCAHPSCKSRIMTQPSRNNAQGGKKLSWVAARCPHSAKRAAQSLQPQGAAPGSGGDWTAHQGGQPAACCPCNNPRQYPPAAPRSKTQCMAACAPRRAHACPGGERSSGTMPMRKKLRGWVALRKQCPSKSTQVFS